MCIRDRFVIAAAILLVQGVRKVPVQYAKRIVGNKQYDIAEVLARVLPSFATPLRSVR